MHYKNSEINSKNWFAWLFFENNSFFVLLYFQVIKQSSFIEFLSIYNILDKMAHIIFQKASLLILRQQQQILR